MQELMKRIHSDNRVATVFYGAIGSLLASALIKYSPAILNWLGEYTFSFLRDFIDSRYAKAATLEPTDYSYFLLALILVFFIIAWMEISSMIKKKQSLKKPKDNKKTYNPKLEYFMFLLTRIVVWFFIGWALLYVAGESLVLNSVTNFKQHIRIVTPYIDQNAKELLISEWSQMKTADDYIQVYDKLIERAKENNLELYRNKQY